MRAPGLAARLAAVVVSLAALASCSPRDTTATRAATSAAATGAGAHLFAPPCLANAQASPVEPAAIHTTRLPGRAFAVATSPTGTHAVVSLNAVTGDSGGALAVLQFVGKVPRVVRTVALPVGGEAFGMTISPDKRLLLVTVGVGTEVVDLNKLLLGAAHPFLGTLPGSGTTAIQVTMSLDGHYAFVSYEDTGEVAVYDLAIALARGFAAPGVLVGYVPVGPGAAGLALSKDGHELFVVNLGSPASNGSISVVSVAMAERTPAAAVTFRTSAGCEPVRVIVSADGRDAWVAAQESDAVLAFDTSMLGARSADALRAVVRVGAAPTGLLMVGDDSALLVANSNRFGSGSSSVDVIDPTEALAGKSAVKASFATGAFSREFGYLQAQDVVLLTNFIGRALQSFTTP